jgi:hypothetical protein
MWPDGSRRAADTATLRGRIRRGQRAYIQDFAVTTPRVYASAATSTAMGWECAFRKRAYLVGPRDVIGPLFPCRRVAVCDGNSVERVITRHLWAVNESLTGFVL